ncbi:TetR/AcrR family transcriptional regulator [uncultured Thiodictyon sp.]|uniref:TetR/AcrR family transcriptional regulator n=1 Tax=uncultured Thiodictyon sp. TaxID=1846217 RepID=UPI0025FDF136|nr:TetR/AcrR family transcriptional regulator [uncultured Thiodictyon sp.]
MSGSTSTTRDNILNVASELYASKGYTAVSMRDVAAVVGVTPANLYHHFKDKECLIRAALAQVFGERTAPLETLLLAQASPAQQFDCFIDWFVRLVFDDTIFSRLLTRELLDGTPERLRYLTQTVFDRPISLLTQVMRARPSDADPVLSVISVTSIILGHRQLAAALPHLREGKADYADTQILIEHLKALLCRAFTGVPDAGRV